MSRTRGKTPIKSKGVIPSLSGGPSTETKPRRTFSGPAYTPALASQTDR
jgi:hypothetical protein